MRHGKRAAVLAAALLATPITLASSLWGQGIGVSAHSSCNSGRFEAVVADPCADGSAVFYNPAALAFDPSVGALGGSIIRNSHTFTADADPGTVFKRGPASPLVPHFWANWRGGERWAVGAGVWAPYGLTLTWPLTFPGRFGGYDNTVKAFYVQPTAAYQLIPKKLSVGAGLDIAFGTVDLNLREDLATVAVPGAGGATFNNFGIPFGTDFASVNLHGTGTSLAGHFGALYKITDALSVGGRFMMGENVNFNNGKATFTQVATGRTLAAGNPFLASPGTPLDALLASQFTGSGALVSRGVKTAITFPAQAVLGVAWKVKPSVELSGDWQWTNWAKWDSVALHFQAPKDTVQQLYLINQNTNTFRVGAQWTANSKLDLRGGWGYNNAAETAIAVSPLLPEAKRNYYAVGAGYHLSKELTADVYYQHVAQADVRGRLYPLTAAQVAAFEQNGGTTGVNTGLYTSEGDLFGATLRYTFGPAR